MDDTASTSLDTGLIKVTDASTAKVTPGTSALFVLSSGAVYDRVADEFRDTEAELISTNLSNDQEAKLREAFGIED